MSITLRAVSVSYGRKVAVDNVSLAALPGQVFALIGPNGSGKSSLLKAIAGLLSFSGTIQTAAQSERSVISYMPQSFQSCAGLTALEVALLGRVRTLALRVTDADLSAAVDALRLVGIENLASQGADKLSGGQRQLVFLAQALIAKPTILLLDEPVSALDLRNQLHVMDLVRRVTRDHALTTIVVLHDLTSAAKFADDVAVLEGGRVAALGSPRAILTPPQIARTFRVHAEALASSAGDLVVYPTKVV